MKVKVAVHYWHDWYGGWEILDPKENGLGDPVVELDEDLIKRYDEICNTYDDVCREIKIAVAKEIEKNENS